MNKLTPEKTCAVIRCLVDGCSVRATVRITGVAKNTIQRITRELGECCLNLQDRLLRNLPCKRVQCDEVWCYCYAKDKNLPDEMRGQPGVGSMWTWTGICAESKLIVSWRLGARDAATAHRFMADIAWRLTNRIQLTTDSNYVYLQAVDAYFNSQPKGIDYAMLHKLYGRSPDDAEMRYSPAKCLGTTKRRQCGNPDPDHISTSYVERQNLNIRMQNRRFTRLTNAFSKKADMLAYSLAITFMYHNFVRIHQTLKTTPAIAAGVAARAWTIEDMAEMLDAPVFRKKVFSN